MTSSLSAPAARTIVLTGSVAPYALTLVELLQGRGHAVHLVPSDRTDHVPSVFEAAHELVPAEPLRALAAEADVVVVLTGLGPLSATIDDAAALDVVFDVIRPGSAIVQLSSFEIFGDRGDARVDESATPEPPPGTEPVHAAETRVLASGDWLRTVVVRAGLVYGAGGGPLIQALVALARDIGLSPHLGRADDTYPLVHADDLTALLVRVIEDERAQGVFHAVTELVDAADLARTVAGLAGVTKVVPFSDEAVAVGTLPGLTSTNAPPRVNLRAVSARGAEIDWVAAGPSLATAVRRDR